MRAFAALYDAIDSTTSTLLKVESMRAYFAAAPPADAAWAVYFLSGRRLKRLVGAAMLRRWLTDLAPLPDWLLEETYAQVGDLAETIALLADSAVPAAPVPEATGADAPEDLPLSDWIEQRLLPLKGLSEAEQRARVTGWWRNLPYLQCLVVNKLLTGAFRVGVSQTLLTRALAQHFDLETAAVAHRLMGHWQPGEAFWRDLGAPAASGERGSRPYPFFLASPLQDPPGSLGPREQWQAEWKWDGIRAQLIRRGGEAFLWSRGEELITDRFPDVLALVTELPNGTVLDGEVLAWNESGVLPFAALQTRIGRRHLTATLLAAAPARYLPYDLLEYGGEDLRPRPLSERRARLDELVRAHAPGMLQVPPLDAPDWESLAALRAESRARGVEGLMLKALGSPYGVGRQRGTVQQAWWKWKIEPHSVDAVLLYAQPGHGRRASLYTDYTFGVWQAGALVPVAKAYSGLSNAEILDLDRWIRQHTTERFGPVRAVEPVQVFELAFEGIQSSSRHKAGLALRFPRIARWRHDKPAAEADMLDNLRRLL
ncbi:MAG: ATP-dependent DNA ligase [Steroidobacteraceae bacterium]